MKMRNKKQFLTKIATAVLSGLMVAGMVMAVTTISENIETAGTLQVDGSVTLGDAADDTVTVSGPMTLSGTTAIGLTLSGTNSTVGLNMNGTFNGASASAINIDLDYDFATIGAEYPAAILINATQTAKHSTKFGGFYGVKAILEADYANVGTYSLMGRAIVNATGAGQEINDVYGVMGEIRLVGADTKYYASTSSIAALRGSISNLASGKFQGQVYGLMLDYGNNANHDGTTALIYGYTHADARADYGIYINNYSPYMTTGLLLTEQNTAASMRTGIDIDVNAIGADANYYGIDSDLTQQDVSGGAYLSRGNLTGVRSDAVAIGNIDHVWAARIGATMTMAANSETNQFYGALMSASASGAYTLTLHDGLVGMQSTVGIDSGVTDVTGGLVAAGFFNSEPIHVNVISPTYTVYLKSGGKTDYGLHVNAESNDLLAGIQVMAYDSAVIPIGLKLTGDTGTITNGINFTGTVTNAFDFATNDGVNGAKVVGTGSGTTNADGLIRIDINGTPYYVPFFAAGSITGEF